MGSTRLPQKILRPILDEPMLAHVVERCRRAETLDEVVVATTVETQDDAIADLCRARGWAFSRGSERDVLDRYFQAAVEHEADAVVRVTSDCPLIDAEVIDLHVRRLMSGWQRFDFVTNMVEETFPLGFAVEAMSFDVLARMQRLSDTERLREHVTTLAYDRPELFLIDHVFHDEDLSRLRLTVDTPADFELIRQIFEHFGHNRFSLGDVLAVLRENPDWLEINRHVAQKVV